MPSTKEEKQLYNEAIREPREQLENKKKQIKDIALKKRKNVNISQYYNLELAMLHLDSVMLYINMNDSSVQYLDLRNSSFLDNARKEFYKAIQMMEEIVGWDIDRSLAENKDYLATVNKLTIRNVLHIARRFSYVFDTLKDKTGESSKWKWSFVDLNVRIAAVIKNMINFSELEQYRNFRSEYFKDREEIIKLCKISLEDAAKEARNKYEMSTKAPEDIRKAVELLTALRSINM
ncbi:MAG: hypothetical protein ACOCWH_03050, partial [Spirochaetota bacterium]